MALLFAEGFDGWASGSDLANATRSINAGAALGSGNTLSNWGDGCLVGSDLSGGMAFGLDRRAGGLPHPDRLLDQDLRQWCGRLQHDGLATVLQPHRGTQQLPPAGGACICSAPSPMCI